MDKELKLLAASIVVESKLSKGAKLQLLNFIQKEATGIQVKALLLDGKIVGKVDAQTKDIINARFENHALNEQILEEGALRSIFGIMISAGGWLAYRALRGVMSEKSRRCGTFSIGSARDTCLMTVKMDETRKTAALLKKEMGYCAKQKDPAKCKGKIQKQIDKLEKKAMGIQTKIRKMAMKGKAVGAGQERARRKRTYLDV